MTEEKFKLIAFTQNAGVSKDRWECPICRRNKEPECRFNLVAKKRGKTHKCRFCKNELILEFTGDLT